MYFDATDYVQSLNKIRDLDLETLCMGHNFIWSISKLGSSAIRRGWEIEQTLEDSIEFVTELARLTECVPSSAKLTDKVLTVARALGRRFCVPINKIERINASSAATIISHFEKPFSPRSQQ